MPASTLVDLVNIVITSSGTGPLHLGAAVQGFRGTDALVDGLTYSYSIQQNGSYELGTATYFAGSDTLVRTPISSSLGNSPISVAPGSTVAFVALAQDIAAPAPNAETVNAVLLALINGLTDIGIGDPPAGPALYLSGGVLKFAKA